MQQWRNAGMQECRNAGMQECKNAGMIEMGEMREKRRARRDDDTSY
jgi:hypothetical protein